MPYVLQERRPALDKVVNRLVENNIEEGDITMFLVCLAHLADGGFANFAQPNKNIEKAIDEAVRADVKPNGDINYILFKYCKYYVKPSYNNIKRFIGEISFAMDLCDMVSLEFKNEFRESAAWIRIKLLTPYEEKKIAENGDV